MVALVEAMLDLHRKRAAAAIPAEQALCQRQIEAPDRQIVALVYELYGLSNKEVRIVEGSARTGRRPRMACPSQTLVLCWMGERRLANRRPPIGHAVPVRAAA
jgi:hypothetical protein